MGSGFWLILQPFQPGKHWWQTPMPVAVADLDASTPRVYRQHLFGVETPVIPCRNQLPYRGPYRRCYSIDSALDCLVPVRLL